MFREDEKEERGVLLFLALLIGLIVAGIFGFAVYQSGALKPLVGDAHVIGKVDELGELGELGEITEAAAGAADGALAATAAGATAAVVSQLEESGLGDAVTTAGSYMQQAVDGQAAEQQTAPSAGTAEEGGGSDSSDSTPEAALSEDSDVTEQQLREAQLEDPHTAQTEAEAEAETDATVALKADDSTLSDDSGAAFSLKDGVARFYFATGKTKVIDGAVEQLGDIVSELKQGGKKAVLSGFVDPRGSVEQNAELAKNRAQAVRNLLVAQGVAEEAIELRKPSDIVPDGTDYAELRRVELRLEEF